MQTSLTRFTRQPFIGIALLALALLSIGASGAWGTATLGGALDTRSLLLAACLAAFVVLAYKFPIYIRHNTKLCITTIPLFLMAVFLPPSMAAFMALIGMLAGEILVQSQRGTYASDIAASVGRWTIVVLVGAIIAHINLHAGGRLAQELPLAAAAAFMWVADLLTLPLALAPISSERPARIVKSAVQEGGIAEASQYVVGILGVLLATQQLWALITLLMPAALVYLAFKKEMDSDTYQLLESMADSVDLRDPYTAGHSRRVSRLVEGLLSQLNMAGQEATQIIAAARFHEIGKIGLPDEVLIKPAALTPEEQALVSSCPDRAAELLSGYPDFSRGVEMVRHHRERWDGEGYPQKLKGTDIPFGARLLAVADSYDAMTSERPYRRALSPDQAAAILRDGRGRQWDAAVVDAFLTSIADQLEQPVPTIEKRADEHVGMGVVQQVTA